MHSSPHAAHHPPSGRHFSPRSSPALFWDSLYMGNPSSIYVDPDGQVVTSSGPAPPAPPNAAPPNAAPNPFAAVDTATQGSSSAVPTDASKNVQTSSGVQTSSVAATTATTTDGISATQSSVTDSMSPTSQTSDVSTIATTSDVSTPASVASTTSVTSVGSTTSVASTMPSASATSSVTSAPTAPSSSTSSSSPSNESSIGASPTSRVNSASSSETASHRTSAYIGLALAAIAGLGLVVAILAWWLRIRSRTRRRKLNTTTAWPWDHDRLGGPRQMSLEGGLGIHGYHAHSPSLFGGEGGPGFPTGHIPHDLSRFPSPLPPPAAHTAQMGSPYVTIPLHGAHQSVPDLAPDLGTLQITNLVPGDLAHGSDSGHQTSAALGVQHTYSADYGTPFLPHRPCFLGVENGGLEVPWGPLRVRRSGTRASEAASQSHSEKLELPLPYPGDIASAADTCPPASDARQGSWAVSIKSNILHAFNAVVGARPSQVAGDCFTPAPQRHNHRGWGRTSSSPSRALPGFSRTSTDNASIAPYVWTLQDAENGARSVDVPAQDPFADNAQIPPVSLPVPRDHTSGLLCPSHPDESLTRASSMYSTASADPSIARIGDEPPQLPSINSLSGSSTDVQIPPVSGRGPQPRKKTRRQRRPTLLARQSSSQHSTSSAGSGMSRTSSACSELTDGERFAKDALRARRRRVMEMSVGRVKTRRARGMTRSGKHGKA
ncbi:hypothetical protein VTO73DRAFT_4427 [Trametes versicolor]